eukprot:11629102-Ditylum_brightwellii.AAC.1
MDDIRTMISQEEDFQAVEVAMHEQLTNDEGIDEDDDEENYIRTIISQEENFHAVEVEIHDRLTNAEGIEYDEDSYDDEDINEFKKEHMPENYKSGQEDDFLSQLEALEDDMNAEIFAITNQMSILSDGDDENIECIPCK